MAILGIVALGTGVGAISMGPTILGDSCSVVVVVVVIVTSFSSSTITLVAISIVTVSITASSTIIVVVVVIVDLGLDGGHGSEKGFHCGRSAGFIGCIGLLFLGCLGCEDCFVFGCCGCFILDSALVELVDDFFYQVCLVGVSLFGDGGGGSGSFVGDLGIDEEGLEVGPGFVCFGTVLPFFDVGSEDGGIHDDVDADVDELLVGFRGSLGFCHCCIFMDLVEDGDDRIIMDIDVAGEGIFRGKEGSTGDVAIGREKVLHGILDGSFDGSGFFVEAGHHDGGIESCGDLVLEIAFELIGFLEETGCFVE